MSLEVEKNAKPASKKRGYWGRFIENEPKAFFNPHSERQVSNVIKMIKCLILTGLLV